MTLGALGVVYGDIGTSPLYALKEVFHGGHVPATHDNILGVLSLIFWTMTIIVSLKYVLLVLRADNNGEGGLIAMLALATMAVKDRPGLRSVLMTVGLFGTAIFYGDGVITPAISVLSAVEGLEVVAPALHAAVIPITLLVLTGLFAVQRFGTGGIGKAFGPITLLWFVALVALGLPHVVGNPHVLLALNPLYAYGFFAAQPLVAFIALGAVVLCVTGGEALYADMGHFGKRPIRIAWYGLVMPALVINYFGQGAMLLEQPEAVSNPFFLMAPKWAALPLVFLATAATVIASQALITAAFSVTKQAVQLGILPRMRIQHTSVRDTGQIYVPLVNWGLLRLHRAGGGAVQELVEPGLGLRHRGHAGHDHHHGDDLLRHPLWLEVLAAAVPGGDGILLRHRRDLLRLEHAQAAGRRLVPDRHRHRHVHADADVDERAQAGARPAAGRSHRAGRISSTRSSSARPRAWPARRCSWPPKRA